MFKESRLHPRRDISSLADTGVEEFPGVTKLPLLDLIDAESKPGADEGREVANRAATAILLREERDEDGVDLAWPLPEQLT